MINPLVPILSILIAIGLYAYASKRRKTANTESEEFRELLRELYP